MGADDLMGGLLSGADYWAVVEEGRRCIVLKGRG